MSNEDPAAARRRARLRMWRLRQLPMRAHAAADRGVINVVDAATVDPPADDGEVDDELDTLPSPAF